MLSTSCYDPVRAMEEAQEICTVLHARAIDATSLRVQEHDGSVQVEVIDLRNPQERRLLWRGFLEPDAARKAASDLEGAAAAAESQ